MGRRFELAQRLERLEKEIHRRQNNNRRCIREAVVGRPVDLDSETTINSMLAYTIPTPASYRQIGQVGLVYLYRDEIRDNLGKTFFNTSQVDNAIGKAGRSASMVAQIGRDVLFLREARSKAPDGKTVFWLLSRLQSAVLPGTTKPIHTKQEELAIANDLFIENMDTTDDQQLWLGAVVASRVGEAVETVEALEDIIPSVLVAEAVQPMPRMIR